MNWDKVSVSSAKIEATVDTTAENVSETFAVTRSGYHNGAWEEYNLAEKLGDGEIIAYTMKFNDGHGLWMGASENDLWEGEDTYLRPDTAADFVGSPSDMYFQNKFGGTEVIGLASHGGTVGKVTAMNKSPFTNKGIEGTYIDKTNPNRYDVEYDIMYARVDGVIYMFVKYGTQENYTLVSKSNWTLPETEVSVQLIYSGRGGHKVDITYKNFSLKQNAQEEIRTLVEKNLVGDCIFDGESGTAVVNGDGQLTSLTGGTLAYEQNGDFIVWDTDTIGDATKGKFFIEGNFTAWGGYNAKNEWKRHQGAGFVLKQMATGKMITIEPSYQTNSELLIQVSEGNGWNTRATLGAKNAPTGENAISFQTEAVASKTNPAKYYMRAEVEGYVWKIWIGKDESTIDFSKPTWEVDMYAHLSTAPGGHGSGSQWSGNSNATKNREDKFPFIADTADGKYKAEGSNTWSAGNICMGYVAFGDAGTAGGCIVSNGSINYVSYDEITAVAKSEALAEIEEYATSLSFTLTDVEKAPIIAMESYKDKAVAVEEAKALIFFTDYKADALAFVSAYATEQGVVLSEEEDAYIKALINDSLTKEEIDANKGRAIALIDAEKNADGSILGVAVKVDEAKQYISDIIAETKEKGITDYAKNMLDEFGAQAITYLDSLYNVETIDQDIAQGKKWTDDMCTAVQMKFTVTILDAKGEVAEEIKDVLFGTEVASLLEGKVASAKEDDKGGLGEYVFKSWSYETEDGVVGGNLEITPEYTYSYYSLTISGSAVDANGNALAGATVVITNAEGATYEGVTDESGAYSIEASLGEINVQISKVGYLARAISTTNGVDKKDGEIAIGVMAIANGVIDHSAEKAMKASYEYTDDLASAVVNNLQLDFASATSGFVYETADVLDKNTYYKFTTKFNGASEDKLAHGINVKTNKYYTTVKKTLTGSNANAGTTVGQVVDNYVFADVAFKMGVGGTFDQGGHTVKVNGQGGEAMTSDKWFYGYSAQSSIPADRQFNIVNDSPFEAFYEKAYRTFVEDTSKYNPNYDIEYDMMYVKDAEGKVKLYGRLGGSVHGWVLMAESKTAIEGKNLIIAQSTRSGEWYINETVKNIESGAIDTETGLPAGEKIDEYLYNTDNASVVRDAEGKETYVLDLTGYAEVTNDGWNQLARGGNGAFAKAYSIKDSYDYLNDGILTLEGKFNAQDGHTGGALTGFYIQDANETGRFYYLGVKSNGGVGLAFANGNGSGWRIFHLQNKACDYFSINKDKLLTWNNGNAKDFYLKGVFEGNKISYYISTEGMPEVSEENWFFTITDLVKLVETQFDTSANAASAIANRMPNSAVNAGIYFNHEGGRGIDRVVVTDFKATYKTSADLLNDAKEEAKKELAIYAESKGVSVVEAMTSKIDAVTSIDGIPSALDAAKQVVDFFASHPEDAEELLDIVGNAIAEIDTAYAGVDKDTLTAKGIEDLDATVAESKATINAIDSVDGAQATADGAVKAVKDKIAQVTGEVVVAFGDNEVTVKYGTLISSIDVSTFTAPTKEDDKGGIGTYQFDKWAVADDAVATAEVTNVEAEFIYNYYAVTVSGTAVDYAGAKLAGVEVSIKHESGAVYTGVTDENGAYSIEALLGASDITWSTPEILDAASRYADINKAYVYARTAKIDADVSVKDAVKTVDVALAYGWSSSNNTVVTSGTYSDDLSDATVEGLAYDFNGYILNPALRTGAVLKENTYYKFTVNFHDGSDGNPAHNIHNSGKYTNASNQFADIGLKMVVGKKAIKINGKNGGVLACDQWCQDYVNDAANANATSQFSRTTTNPFSGLFENSFRGAGSISRVLADYDKPDMDIMYVKTTDNHVDIYGKLTNSDSDWVKLGDGTVAGDWITLTMGTRSGEFAHNWTLEGIEYGAIDTETNLPAGAKVDAYTFTATNASAAWDNETNGYEYELNISGNGNCASDTGGDGTYGMIYDNTKTYKFGTGRLVVEGDFTVVQGRAGGAAFGITLRDSASTTRKLSVLMRSNSKQVVFGLNDGNCNGARTWNGLDKLKSNANSTVYNTDMVKEWHSAQEKNIHLKYVFDNNTLTVYYDGIKFFSVENLTEFIKTALDANAETEYNNKYPTSDVYVGMYFNHENGFGTDRARVKNFKVTYNTDDELVAKVKTDATAEVNEYAASLNTEATEADLAPITSYAHKVGADYDEEALAIVNASKLSIAKNYAKAQVIAYAEQEGFTNTDGGIAIVDAMVDYNKLEEIIVEAKAKVDYDNNEGARLAVEALKTQALADIDAVVAESGVTAYGQTYLDNAKATAKATVNAITTLDEAEASEIIEGALKVATDAKAVADSNVSLTFYGNDAQEVRYGALVADNLDGVKLVNMSTDAGYTYATAWDYAEGAVVTTDTTINPKGVFTANGLSGENGALTATCGNENGNFNVNEHMIYTKTVGDAENGVFEAEGFLTVKYNGNTHQGGGIRITQLSTGKVITFALGNNKTNSSELMASVNPTGDGWDGRIILNASNVDAYNAPTGENAIAFTSDGSEVTYYVRAEVDGYSVKLWYGKDASTIDLNNPTFYIKDIYSKFRDLTNGHGGGYVWSDEGVKKFPFYAGETSDGNYQGTGSDIAIGFTAFYHGGGTDNQTTLTNGKITYTANTDSVEKVNAIKTTALNTANGIEVADATAYGVSEFNTAKADALADIEAIATLDEATAQAEADAIIASLNAVKTKVEANIAVTFEGNDTLSVKYGTVLSSIDTASLIVPEKEADAYSYNVFTGWATSDANVVEEVSVKANFENKTSYALTGKAVDERGNVLSGVSVKAVVAGKEGDVIAETTTAEDGSFSFDVAVGTSTSITFAKQFHFGKAISYTDKKTATTALDNAVMPWTFALDGNGGELAIDGNTLDVNDLASTLDTSKLSYNYYGEKRYNQWLDTNLAVGEAITLSFKWNERQQSDRDPNMKFKYGNVDNLSISSMGTGKTNWDSSANDKLFDFGGPKDITINGFTGKVYDYAFVREEGTLKMYGKHGGGEGWVLMATENIAATNTGTTFCFGYSTAGRVNYDFSVFNAKKVAPSEVTGNIGTYIVGSWGSGMKLADGSYALWGTFAHEGTEVKTETETPRFSGAGNSSKVYTPEKYDMTTNRVVVESDLMLGTDHPHQTSGLLISNGTNQFVLGFKQNKIAMQFGIGNGWTHRCWAVSSSLQGVNYYNQQALEQVGLYQGGFQSASFHAKWEIEGTDVNVYVDDVLAFSADYEVLMTNFVTSNDENKDRANTSKKVPTKSAEVQFGYLANHETYIYSNAYAANHFRVTPIAIATDNTQAIADAKASAIAKINAIDVAKLSPAGAEYYNSNKATAIEAITAYTAVEGDSITATIGAIEALATPVLLTNKDYEVMIAGYGTVSAKWGTVIDTLVEGKTASSFGDTTGYYYNTDGKFAYTAGAKITGYTRIYPSVAGGRKIDGASAITLAEGGTGGRGYMTGEATQYLTGNVYDVNKATLTMRATYSVWAGDTGKPQGLGFRLIQPATGRSVMITTDYNTTSLPYITATNTNDGWGLRGRTPAATNAITHDVQFINYVDGVATASTYGSREFDFQMQIKGNTIKIWIGAVNATFNDSNVNYVMNDYYAHYTSTAGFQGSNTQETLLASAPNFADDGNVVVGVPFFHDYNGKVQIRNLSIKQA